MLKVKVRKIGVAVAGATSMLALGQSTMGCAFDATPESGDGEEPTGQARQAIEPGSATLMVQVQSWGDQEIGLTVQNATTDEFVRVGESLSVDVRASDFWWLAHPSGSTGYDDIDRLEKLNVQVTAYFYHNGTLGSSETVSLASWSDATSAWELIGTTDSFVVPDGTDVIQFSYQVTDAGDASVNLEIPREQASRVVVFGDRPEKHIVFDNDFSELRERVIEGGDLPRGRDVMVGYSDHRADTVANASALNTEIGTQKNHGRFGPDIIPIHGKLAHEVTLGMQVDGVWGQEAPMVQRLDSAMVSRSQPWSRRFAFERRVSVPAVASQIAMFFHIKTYLEVDYSRYPNAVDRYYDDGDRILVSEVWDNNGGSGNDYHFDTQQSGLPPVEAREPDIRRTVIFVRGATSVGQDMFVRGGLDHKVADVLLGRSCTDAQGNPDYSCAVPITLLNRKNTYNDAWKTEDSFLDWYGAESGQTGTVNGQAANGTAADWTTNYWPPEWGAEKTVEADGHGVEKLNKYCGMHCWMVDVEMDCSQAYHSPDGTPWFEVKSFISNGPGWESDARQGLDTYYGYAKAPYASKNHVGRCGMVNVFHRGDSTAEIYRFDELED